MSDEPEKNVNANQPDDTPIIAKVIGDAPIDPNTNVADPTAAGDGTTGSGGLDSDEIRVGSPFIKDPDLWDGVVVAPRKPERFYDLGPLRYTAIGAVAASVMVLGFALVAFWWFPGGGTLIAALGCALAVFGLYSQHRRTASVCLILHLLLFIASYSRAIST